MEITGIKYVGPILDNSGYAKAARENIMALLKQGVPLTINPISFEKAQPELKEDEKILYTLVKNKIDYNVVLIHTTPEFWPKLRETNKVNVGYTIWETTKLHYSWPKFINANVVKVLVGCEWNKGVFKDSGVTIPIGVVPHCMDINTHDNIKEYEIGGIDKDAFVYYGIFQFTNRKNPLALLKAYWRAFQNNENVALILKTYRSDYSEVEKEAVRNSIKNIKKTVVFPSYPKIFLIPDMLTEDEISSLHARGDCYLSLDRGEGFGYGPFGAGANGNPIIITDFGGSLEYAKPDNSYLVNYQLTPVSEMIWTPWYDATQDWAEADIIHGAKLIRHVYEHQDEAKEKGQRLKKYITENFSREVVGQKLIKELEEI